MRLVDADNARECFGGDGVTGAVMKRMFDSLRPLHLLLRPAGLAGDVFWMIYEIVKTFHFIDTKSP